MMRMGADRSVLDRGSKATLPLTKYPVAYLSRLQRILPAARWELRFKASHRANPPCEGRQRHVPLGAEAPYCWSANGRRAHASLLARILT
ncbi:hypothetical protein VNO78_39888 [Psophocarpus tetragonolobus]|uniref:Uncharacterized protein n=1 Tax=Psophocarpus tetragonolobus TaxID=3891 RepID=A0AAN9RGA4_PSOTE